MPKFKLGGAFPGNWPPPVLCGGSLDRYQELFRGSHCLEPGSLLTNALQGTDFLGSRLQQTPNLQLLILAISAEVSKTRSSRFGHGSERVNRVRAVA
jgi:hypothetical protein